MSLSCTLKKSMFLIKNPRKVFQCLDPNFIMKIKPWLYQSWHVMHKNINFYITLKTSQPLNLASTFMFM